MPPGSIRAKPAGNNPSIATIERDPGHRRHVANLVYHELIEAGEGLTLDELAERTLLPKAVLIDSLREIWSRGMCRVIEPRTENQPRQFVADPSAYQ